VACSGRAAGGRWAPHRTFALLTDRAAYIAIRLTVLNMDNRCFFSAAADAQRTSEHLHELRLREFGEGRAST
jgi:antirestriction protein ArdC